MAALVARAAGRVPKGLWITGGDIGAAAAWEADARGEPRPAPLQIGQRTLDAITIDHPVLLRRADGAYVANSPAIVNELSSSSALRRARPSAVPTSRSRIEH